MAKEYISKNKKLPILKEKCASHKESGLDYLASHLDANKRHAKGQKQQQCPTCGYWLWEDLF